MAPKKNVTPAQARRDRGERPVFDSYGRLSRVPETGELEKIETQWEDNRKVIDRLGGVLGEELSDGLSAWKRNVRRPGWKQLLERVQAGQSDGIVVWHTDRLFRQPRDLEALIELGDRGFLVASAHGTRDLSDADDRFILRIEVAHAARSSDDTSRRIRRRFETMRTQGQRTGGARPFGMPGHVILSKAQREALEAAGDERPVVTPEQVAAERRLLAEGTRDRLAGLSWAEIARRWNAAGMTTPRGNRWESDTVRRTLNRPINAGLIHHGGVVVGTLAGVGTAAVDAAALAKVQASTLAARRGRVSGRKYVGSGILRCGVCGHTLNGRLQAANKSYRKERRAYTCPAHRGGCGKVAAPVHAVDPELRQLVIERLSDPQHAAQVTAFTSKRAERLAEVRAEIHEVEQLQEGLAARLGRREMKLPAFDAANGPLVRQLADLVAERDALDSGGLGPVEVATAEEIAAEWDALVEADDVPGLRVMLRSALGRHQMIVDRATSRGPRFDPTRLRLAMPQDPPQTVSDQS